MLYNSIISSWQKCNYFSVCLGFSIENSVNGTWSESEWGTVATIQCKKHFVVFGARELTCGDGWSSDPSLTSCERLSKLKKGLDTIVHETVTDYKRCYL